MKLKHLATMTAVFVTGCTVVERDFLSRIDAGPVPVSSGGRHVPSSGGVSGDGGHTFGSGGSAGTGSGGAGGGGMAIADGGVSPPPCDPADGCDPEVATSQARPPWGIWSMIVQYGPVGVPVQPTVPMQVEIRPDGNSYRWVCVGAPADGSLTQACARPTRIDCLSGTNGWDGTRWRVDFPEARVGGVPEQFQIVPDGHGRIFISYINPTYSGGLFWRVGEATAGAPSCTP